MATIACPGCGMPRAEELFGATACPVCGATASSPPAEPVAELTPRPHRPRHGTADSVPLDLTPDRTRGSSLGLGVFLGFALGTAVGIAGVLGWQAVGRTTPPGTPTTADTESPGPAVTEPVALAAAPMPREAGSRSVSQFGPPAVVEVPLPDPAAPPPAAVAPEAPPAPAAPPAAPPPPANGAKPEPAPANPFRPAAPLALRVDKNLLDETTQILRPGERRVLRGSIKRLRVAGLDGGAELDCSDLEAEEVIVTGPVAGGAKLHLKAPNGRVTFQAKIDSKATVNVYAPGGEVTFAVPTAPPADGSKIDGGSKVDITAKTVRLNGLIAGAGTKVEVTLTADGSLSFAEIAGTARLEYGKADPDDPDPTVKKGRVEPPAAVQMVE